MLQHSVKQCQPFYFIKEKRLFNITILIFEKEKLLCIRNFKKIKIADPDYDHLSNCYCDVQSYSRFEIK